MHRTSACLLLQTKKTFVPLPSLEQLQGRLPWHIAFSQRLGRHAIASRDIEAGERVLAEAAVVAVPAHMHQEESCHTCLQELPHNSQKRQPIVDATSGGYKRYCSPACHNRDAFAVFTSPVHAVIPQLAEDTGCDPTLLHVILELDARCQQSSEAASSHTANTAGSSTEAPYSLRPGDKALPVAPSEAPAMNGHQSGHAAPSSATASRAEPIDASEREDSTLVVSSTIGDVQALLGPWDRNEQSWRQALAAGQTFVPILARNKLYLLIHFFLSFCVAHTNFGFQSCHSPVTDKTCLLRVCDATVSTAFQHVQTFVVLKGSGVSAILVNSHKTVLRMLNISRGSPELHQQIGANLLAVHGFQQTCNSLLQISSPQTRFPTSHIVPTRLMCSETWAQSLPLQLSRRVNMQLLKQAHVATCSYSSGTSLQPAYKLVRQKVPNVTLPARLECSLCLYKVSSTPDCSCQNRCI